MSEWNRSGREDEARWRDRDEGRRSRGGQGRREQRSFAEAERGYDDQDWLEAQRYGGPNYAAYGGSGYPGVRGYEARLQNPRYDEDRSYDRPGYWRPDYGRPDYGRPDYAQGRDEPRGAQRYGRSGGQAGFAHNPMLERVTEGRGDHGWTGLGHRGEGTHRGRGPKNYTRSDERIREDVNDRLCDDAWLDASDIEVQVANGEVTLNGTVNQRDDKRHAEDIAEQVSAVKHVQNNLRVQPKTTTAETAAGQATDSRGAGSQNTGANAQAGQARGG
jgi:hypothetical protein